MSGVRGVSGARRVAAIDCGTNSIRLLIADVPAERRAGAPALRDVTRLMRVVRLGQGVDRTGYLAEEALARTFAAAEDYAALCREHDVEAIRFVATSATRDAANRDVFVAGIKDRLGVAPEVIAGEEEAALSFAGALSSVGTSGPTIVVDIGGGSSELVLGTETPSAQFSMNVGCVRITERHLHSDPPTAAEIAVATADIDAAIDEAERHVDLSAATRLVGLAGSVTTITAHALALPAYDSAAIDGTHLSVEQIHDACSALLHESRQERGAHGFMHPGRVDVIGAGALVWSRIVARVHARTREAGHPIDDARTSEHDILDGIALSAAARA
ncbi:exopolyphosphatase [Bowdeniella nasicola]|uniref:Exopolyphosphatase n=1 Tax=Bowdeniella nasicola TaxID=208480 RepID=A0A1Q5Q254_9ACTO|nr:Ppx/GppA phosphatase family protein [Bowdeniella nasicola]OKL53799.1 exopolyphosphatase [Bowdeniella nasicola]